MTLNTNQQAKTKAVLNAAQGWVADFESQQRINILGGNSSTSLATNRNKLAAAKSVIALMRQIEQWLNIEQLETMKLRKGLTPLATA